MTYRIHELDKEKVLKMKYKGLSNVIIASRLGVTVCRINQIFKEIKNGTRTEGCVEEGKIGAEGHS